MPTFFKPSSGLKDVISLYGNNNATAAANTSPDTTTPKITTPIKQKPESIINKTPVKKTLSEHHSSSSSEDDDEEEKTLKVLSSSPSSPNFKSPKNKTSSLKQKRVKNIVNQLPAIKSMDDVVKLQEEITENRDKISMLQQQLNTVQKEKSNIETEKQTLLQQLKDLENKIESTEQREKECLVKLEEMELKNTQTIESLHQEFDSKMSRIRVEKTISDNLKHQEIVSLKDQLSLLASQNEVSKQQLEKAQKENDEKAITIKSKSTIIETLESDIKQSNQSNQEMNTTLNSTNETLKNVRKELFYTSCLAIKLDMVMSNKPCNISTQDLWEVAESQQITPANFAKWITQKLMEYQRDMPPPSPMKQIKSNTTTTTTTTTTTGKSPKRNSKKK